jgi:peptidoglycan-associated lipoprotein
MKMKLFCSTALALAVIMASTGCRHKPVAVTPIPGESSPSVTGLPPGGTLPPGGYGGGTGQPIALNPNWDVSQFNQDRDALAAYTIHFAYDSAVIRDNEQTSLQSVASALQSDPNAKLLIEGNCDERGTEEYNRSLGERRALAAREALAKLGVNPDRIRTISYGKDKPADPGHDDAAWSKNRRDDFVLLHPKMGA